MNHFPAKNALGCTILHTQSQNFSGVIFPRIPATAPRCLDADINFCLARQRFHRSCLTKRPLLQSSVTLESSCSALPSSVHLGIRQIRYFEALKIQRFDTIPSFIIGVAHERKKEERKIYLPRTITPSSKKNKETILKLVRSRLPEKQKAIYADRQHC